MSKKNVLLFYRYLTNLFDLAAALHLLITNFVLNQENE